MRRVHAIFAILAATVPARAAMRLTAADFTVVLDFKEPFNQTAVVSMKREASEIPVSTGLRLEWRNPQPPWMLPLPIWLYSHFAVIAW